MIDIAMNILFFISVILILYFFAYYIFKSIKNNKQNYDNIKKNMIERYKK